MTTTPAENSADPLADLLRAQRANRAETTRAEVDDDDRAAAALAAGMLEQEPPARDRS